MLELKLQPPLRRHSIRYQMQNSPQDIAGTATSNRTVIKSLGPVCWNSPQVEQNMQTDYLRHVRTTYQPIGTANYYCPPSHHTPGDYEQVYHMESPGGIPQTLPRSWDSIGTEYSIKVKENAKAYALFTPRNVPIALRPKLKEELTCKEKNGSDFKGDRARFLVC